VRSILSGLVGLILLMTAWSSSPAGQAGDVWVLTETWTSSFSTPGRGLYGRVDVGDASATIENAVGQTKYTWSEPPKTVAPGGTLTLDLAIEKEPGTFGRGYLLVLFGTPSEWPGGAGPAGKRASGGSQNAARERREARDKNTPTTVMIPPSMDWAGTKPDEGPLFAGEPVPFEVKRGGKVVDIVATLRGRLFLESNTSAASSTWTGHAPPASPDAPRFLLVVSAGHALRQAPGDEESAASVQTQSMAGARYYEYLLKR
jgi:hypothetical protein